jgi:hypothetical protein
MNVSVGNASLAEERQQKPRMSVLSAMTKAERESMPRAAKE